MEKKISTPTINISTEEKEKTFSIKIWDNGGGVSSTIIDKIFDPYFTTKDSKKGTGLGLYMSKIIVEEHNLGKLEAYNVDNGVCFEITLYKGLIH
ncbi:MAG: HAMP domain-containing histidine kinase [Campylobacterales bacterium]|nr:HAMP domain-containing histidine kinase [Campylobacterales bacterium]